MVISYVIIPDLMCSLEGVEPSLRLTTEDGAMLVDSDPVSLILSSNELVGSVQSWKLAPLTTRYKEACQAANTSNSIITSVITCIHTIYLLVSAIPNSIFSELFVKDKFIYLLHGFIKHL